MSNDTTPENTDPDYDALEAESAVHDAEATSSLLDPAVISLFAWVRGFMRSVLETDYETLWPGNLLRGETIWQWARFDLLDWLHPIEKLLRRILVIEAYALLESQALPPARPGREGTRSETPARAASRPARQPPARPAEDPDLPERWRVSFRVFPRERRERARRARLPLPRNDDGAVIPLRFRAVAWDAAPLARRLEAVIRVCRSPAPFIRRIAFRLRATGRRLLEAIVRLCAQRPADKFARDANSTAAVRLLELQETFWSSS